jgi:cation transporter-like permease
MKEMCYLILKLVILLKHRFGLKPDKTFVFPLATCFKDEVVLKDLVYCS